MIELLGWSISYQALVIGATTGLVYSVLAAGIVLLYRSTGVINFAQAEIGTFSAVLFALLAAKYGVWYWVSLPLAIATGVLFSAVIELTVVRRLFNAPRLILFIATAGVAQLVIWATISLPDLGAAAAEFPMPFNVTWEIGSITLRAREILVLVLVPIITIGLGVVLTRTKLGLAIRATADNADTARLFGISAKRTSTIVWGIAGGFAAITSILAAGISGVAVAQVGAASLGPGLLLRALAIALIARMSSLPATIYAGVTVGVFEAVLLRNVDIGNRRLIDVYLFLAILVAVLLLGRRGRVRDEGSWSLSPKLEAVPERLKALWWPARLPAMGIALVVLIAALLPVFMSTPSRIFVFSQIFVFAIIGLSVSTLTGWAGQLSLGQFAFVGLGGLTMAGVYLGHPIPLIGSTVQLPWGVAVVIGTAVGVLGSLLVGIPALRVRGLMLAVTTLAFSVAAASWLLNQRFFLGDGFDTLSDLPKPVIGPFDLSSRKTYYYFCLIMMVIAVVLVSRLRRTGIGRSMIAVRDNQDMAAANSVSSTRMKLLSFALSGGLAAFAGCLLVTMLPGLRPDEAFASTESIRVVGMAIIGGLGSVGGAVLGAIWVVGLPAMFNYNDAVALFTSGAGLLILLMYFPGGLVSLAHKVRMQLFNWAESRLPPVTRDAGTVAERAVPKVPARVIDLAPGQPLLRTTDVYVRFGGVVAVDAVSVEVHEGEIVGLIGANGAGKSTLMNAISGFVPATGRIEVLGKDVSEFGADRRHRLGLGRGFQAAKLYPDLTVRETIQVALEARRRSLFLPSLLALPPSPHVERVRAVEAAEIIDFLGLGRYADRFISNLSTGTRRIVEFGCLLAVGAKVLLLDEPTGGVAQKETEAFGPMIRRLQRELGAAVLLIEHDMPMVMSISDRIYCMEAGRQIAHGTPHEVRNDPLVIASYLGTDERAIQRSGQQASTLGTTAGLVAT